jgi:hypothetical protein
MRLLNAQTREMKEFVSDNHVPPYAILSHTWGEGEISLANWLSFPAQKMKEMHGYRKIDFCCRQAIQDSLSWVWVDTYVSSTRSSFSSVSPSAGINGRDTRCCIDKTSSAELSEAINSMFRWYQQAAVCYVYLADASQCQNSKEIETQISKSRWFTRGWTLQELLAPEKLLFFSEAWAPLGSKSSLRDLVSQITGIEGKFLDRADLHTASVSKKMAWAANRQTTRTEDTAYCLLGLFDINMPLLYGEGKKAFQRLQEEIIRSYPYDHTLYAWGIPVARKDWSRNFPPVDDDASWPIPVPWSPDESERRLRGLLADSPADFQFSGNLVPWHNTTEFYVYDSFKTTYPVRIGQSIQIELPYYVTRHRRSVYHWAEPRLVQCRFLIHALLLCGLEASDGPTVWMPLQPSARGFCGRTEQFVVSDTPVLKADYLSMTRMTLRAEPETKVVAQHGDLILGMLNFQIYPDDICCRRWRTHATPEGVLYVQGDGLIRQVRECNGRLFALMFDFGPERGVGICLERARSEGDSLGPIEVSIVPLSWRGDDSLRQDGIKWIGRSKVLSAAALVAKVMETSGGVFEVDHPSLPRIRVRVERMGLHVPKAVVDVVVIDVEERKETKGESSGEGSEQERESDTDDASAGSWETYEGDGEPI